MQMRVRAMLGVLAGAATVFLVGGEMVTAVAATDGFNQPGNVLIADQFNNRVIEVNRDHRVVWSFGNGSKPC